jgi:phenylacetate-CoA ligase
VLTRPDRLDELTVRVERRADVADGDSGPALATLIKNTIGVSVRVEVLAPGAVERSLGKMRRIVDER